MLYYNRTNGPLAITLVSGASTIAPPKAYFEIPKGENTSSSVADHVAKGHIVMAAVQPEDPVTAPAPVVVTAPAVENKTVAIEATTSTAPVAEKTRRDGSR
jgi:hypothetical protein